MTPWKCSQCGEIHDTIPNSFSFDAPGYWGNRRKWPAPKGCSFNKDYCVVDNTHYFIRAILEIPILGTGEVFTFGVWSTLSELQARKEASPQPRPRQRTTLLRLVLKPHRSIP